MSGVVKGVKKTFKKVAKVAKKVAPLALAATAVYFTAGAALGLTGSMGAMAGSLTQSLGLTGTLGNVVTGAITQAGYGAAIGTLTSAVTGGDISEGAMYGALGGAVTGGVTGGLGMTTDPLAPSTSSTGNGPGVGTTSPAVTGSPMPGDVGDGLAAVTGQPAGVSAAPVGSSTQAASAGTRGLGGDLLGRGGWVERNGELVGGVVKGLGQGLLAGMGDQADIEAAERRRAQVSQNYTVGTTGLMGDRRTSEAAYDATGNPTPAERYPTTSAVRRTPPPPTGGRMRYAWNRATGRMELQRV